jgi:hypothetical protein
MFHFGDLFCAMQGKWDKRADQDELIPALRGNNYLDKLVTHVHKLVAPHQKQYAIISPGNHEGSILKRYQTDLTERLVDRMQQAGSHVQKGPYAGFIRIVLEQQGGHVERIARDLFFHHGYGGGGEVTRGMIDNSRIRGQWEADIYYQGHIHRKNMDINEQAYLCRSGEVRKREQLFLRGGAYKVDDEAQWHIETGKGPRPRGGWWLRLRWIRTSNRTSSDLEITPLAEL